LAIATQRSQQIVEVQAVRAFAAVLVAWAHIHHEFLERAVGWPWPLGAFGVDLFFVISGFIMVHVGTPLFQVRGASANFFLKRLARIAPIYWAATIIFVLYILESQPFSQANVSWPNIIGSLLFLPIARPSGDVLPTFSVGWTLNYEMFFYLLFSIGLLVRRRVALILMALGLVALVHLGKVYSGQWHPSVRFLAHPIIVEFALGMGLAVIYQRGWRISRWLAVTLVALAFAFLVSLEFAVWAVVQGRGYTFGVAAALVIAAAVLHDWNLQGQARRIAIILGDSSYALYLIHPLTMLAVREISGRIWAHYHVVLPVTTWPVALTLLAGTILLAVAIHRRLERPLTAWLYRYIDRRFPVGPRSPPAPDEQAARPGGSHLERG